MEETIHNPVLKGFNPDPSIIRVEDDYYIATSTFQWFPGVQIHHSRDLINWQLLMRPLDRIKQLNMKAVPDSGGIWAPCLTWDNGAFYLVYTVTDELNSIAKDLNNYLVTSEDITGPWSDPVYLNSTGFDPSLFHDDDGRKWLVNMVWDHRPGKNPFHGITLQEYSPSERKLIGESKMIFEGTDLGSTEAPHLYRHNGCYYLLTAEGGTGWEHAVTVARAEKINGPYQIHPDNPILTSAGDRSLALQKAGHADIVKTQNGEWYMAHLSSRPLPKTDRCILGRETSLQKIVWKNDWPYLASGQNRPQEHVPGPNLPAATGNTVSERDDFDSETLGIDFQMLRVPLDEDSLSLTERPGFLRLKGGQSLQSRFDQALVARRQQAFCYTARTCLEFFPDSFQQMAGLVCYYSTRLYHYLYMSTDEQAGTCLYVQTADDSRITYPLGDTFIDLKGANRVFLSASMKYDKLDFDYSPDGHQWHPACGGLDSSILSDDYGTQWGFTGAFVGLACQDLSGSRKHADFDFFEYQEHPDKTQR